MSRAIFSVLTITAYLTVYIGLISLDRAMPLAFYMLPASPFLVAWMVWSVLREPYKYPELEENEEWGYRDRAKEELDIF
jgi:hypothetical protein